MSSNSSQFDESSAICGALLATVFIVFGWLMAPDAAKPADYAHCFQTCDTKGMVYADLKYAGDKSTHASARRRKDLENKHRHG